MWLVRPICVDRHSFGCYKLTPTGHSVRAPNEGNTLKKSLLFGAVLFTAGFSAPADARDEHFNMPLAEALSMPEAQARLTDQITFSFGDEPHGTVQQHLGEFSSSKRTRGFSRSFHEACHWVFLTAMLEFQKRAESLGANAVINIRSNWRNNQTSSSETYVCAKGGLMAGVALIGEFVVLD